MNDNSGELAGYGFWKLLFTCLLFYYIFGHDSTQYDKIPIYLILLQCLAIESIIIARTGSIIK